MATSQAGLTLATTIPSVAVHAHGGIDGVVDDDSATKRKEDKDDGANLAVRVNAARSFERPTENFIRKTGMRDKGPPGFEYNSTTHLAIASNAAGNGTAIFMSPSAGCTPDSLPGIHVHTYAASPTRDDRVSEAKQAAQMRTEQAQRMAAKAQRDKNMTLRKKGGYRTSSQKTLQPVRTPRPRALEELAWREALKIKAAAISASPRAQQQPASQRWGRGGRGVGASRNDTPKYATKHQFLGVRVSSDDFQKPFAGGTELDTMPGRVESLVFPERYMTLPGDEVFPTFTRDVATSPIRHAASFRSAQPRIVTDDSRRETRGWAGPGAYEWDDSIPPAMMGDKDSNDDISRPDHGSPPGGTGILRPRGIVVRDPSRESAFFRPESRGFIAPCQPNVREYSPAPAIDNAGGNSREQQEEGGEGGQQTGSPSQKRARGGNFRRKRPRRLWMFQPAGKQYVPPAATKGWGGPGAYNIDGNLTVKVRDPGKLSPVFQEGSGRRGPARPERNVVAFPERPCAESAHSEGEKKNLETSKHCADWAFSTVVFEPPEPKTIAHDARTNVARFSPCFLSTADRFEPVGPYAFVTPENPPWRGPGDVGRSIADAGAGSGRSNGVGGDEKNGEGGGRGRGYRGTWGPVERYDFVSARKHTSASTTWLGTSIRSGPRSKPSVSREQAAGNATIATGKPTSINPASSPAASHLSSSQAHSRDDKGTANNTRQSQLVEGELVAEAEDTSAQNIDATSSPITGSLASGEAPAPLLIVEETGGSVDGSLDPLPSTGGATVDKRPFPAPSSESEVTGRVHVPSRMLPAADVANEAAVEAAIAGLARDWPGCRKSEGAWVTGAAGGERERRLSTDISESWAQNNVRSLGNSKTSSIAPRSPPTERESKQQQRVEDEETAGYLRRGGAKQGPSASRGAKGVIPKTNAMSKDNPDARSNSISLRVDEPDGQQQVVAGVIAAARGGSVESIPTDGQAPVDGPHSSAAGTDATTIRTTGTSDGEPVGERHSSDSFEYPSAAAPTEAASEEAGVVAMGQSCGSFDRRQAPGDLIYGGMFIQTIGRAMRGPCMLTMSPSRHGESDSTSWKPGAHNSEKKGKSSTKTKKSMWEPEPDGGLLGPGQIRVLVC